MDYGEKVEPLLEIETPALKLRADEPVTDGTNYKISLDEEPNDILLCT